MKRMLRSRLRNKHRICLHVGIIFIAASRLAESDFEVSGLSSHGMAWHFGHSSESVRTVFPSHGNDLPIVGAGVPKTKVEGPHCLFSAAAAMK